MLSLSLIIYAMLSDVNPHYLYLFCLRLPCFCGCLRRQTYKKMFGDERRVRAWTAGDGGSDAAGWHCSWCLDVDGIRTKLTSAQNGDFPRWGDYPDRLNATYIKRLVARGIWFDNVKTFQRYDVISGPPGLFTNERRYWKLIHNVYRTS